MNEIVLNAKLRSSLLKLLAAGGSGSKSELGVEATAKELAPLLERKLVLLEKRGRSHHLELTDAGWRFVQQSFGELVTNRSRPSGVLLSGLFQRFQAILARHEIPLAELFMKDGPSSSPPSDNGVTNSGSQVAPLAHRVSEQIEAVCRSVAGQRRDGRIRLFELREKLPGLAERDLNEALLEMDRKGSLRLYRFDDPTEIKDRDRQAALKTKSGEPRHFVRLTLGH